MTHIVRTKLQIDQLLHVIGFWWTVVSLAIIHQPIILILHQFAPNIISVYVSEVYLVKSSSVKCPREESKKLVDGNSSGSLCQRQLYHISNI